MFAQTHILSPSMEVEAVCMVQASYLKLGDVSFRFSGFREKFKLGFTVLLSVCSIHLNFSLS